MSMAFGGSAGATSNNTVVAHGKQVFTSIGSDQFFTVPAGVTSLSVKLWGAAGGTHAGVPL